MNKIAGVRDTDRYVLDLTGLRHADLPLVGGKAAGLGELTQVDGAHVPAGFCVTTAVFQQVTARAGWFADLLGRLEALAPEDGESIRAVAGQLRRQIERAQIAAAAAAQVVARLRAFPAGTAFAVRSSATAEDLPWASFAGQQDSFLNVIGTEAVLHRIRSCWASLFTERAVAYRVRHGIDHRAVQMAVVVQQMLAPEASGVLFTADPMTGNRTVTQVEATLGLGEALVSGQVDPDSYRVSDAQVVDRRVTRKTTASYAVGSGGTRQQTVPVHQQDAPVLTEAQVLAMVGLGRRVEAHFGRPQDIEWCLVAGAFHLVQSRPITTLFPVPAAQEVGNRVYLSVGHQQMMTEAIRPLGISFWQLTTPRPMAVAGGRLFVDVTERLGSPAAREGLLADMGRSDPLMGDALETVLAREGYLPEGNDPVPPAPHRAEAAELPDADPALVSALVHSSQASLAGLAEQLAGVSGPAVFAAIRADLPELRQQLFNADSMRVIMAGMTAAWWLNEQLADWLGEVNPADTLTRSVPDNITSQMGLALLDVADVVRQHPQVVAFLRETDDPGFLHRLDQLPGGDQARAAIESYLDQYGMRCVGEIDITRPRWVEQPTALLPALLGHVDTAAPGEGRRRFAEGVRAAQAKEQELLTAVRALPGGAAKAAETKRMIDRLRAFTGYREYPKYAMVSRYLLYKRALLAEARSLADEGVLAEPEEVFFLTFDELAEAVRTRQVDREAIDRRAREHEKHRALVPPRVLTSDGEAVVGRYRRESVPDGALAGLPVSAGVVQGRARVVHDVADAELAPGDILVTTSTDPSWSPLFVTIAGLVTEVGGMMTHGAVVAREYGLVAVVGVPGATQQIRDGDQVRVDGTRGWVQVLS